MAADPEPPGPTATGWARLPRWQHVVLTVLCALGLVAAIANTIASSGGSRALHAALGLILAVVLVTLIGSLRRRPRQ